MGGTAVNRPVNMSGIIGLKHTTQISDNKWNMNSLHVTNLFRHSSADTVKLYQTNALVTEHTILFATQIVESFLRHVHSKGKRNRNFTIIYLICLITI